MPLKVIELLFCADCLDVERADRSAVEEAAEGLYTTDASGS